MLTERQSALCSSCRDFMFLSRHRDKIRQTYSKVPQTGLNFMHVKN